MPKISFRDIDNMDCSCHGKMSGEGLLGKLPTDIERLMEKNKDKMISKITIFRLPLADELVKVLNVLTNDSVKKFLKRDEKHDNCFILVYLLRRQMVICLFMTKPKISISKLLKKVF